MVLNLGGIKLIDNSLFTKNRDDGEIRVGNLQVYFSDEEPTLRQGQMLIWDRGASVSYNYGDYTKTELGTLFTSNATWNMGFTSSWGAGYNTVTTNWAKNTYTVTDREAIQEIEIHVTNWSASGNLSNYGYDIYFLGNTVASSVKANKTFKFVKNTAISAWDYYLDGVYQSMISSLDNDIYFYMQADVAIGAAGNLDAKAVLIINRGAMLIMRTNTTAAASSRKIYIPLYEKS
jgi:hypothetical protein